MQIDYILPYIDFNQPEIQELYNITTGKNIYNLTRNYTYIDLTLTLKLILKNLPFINKLYITCKDIQKLPDDTEQLIDEMNDKIVRINESEFMPNNYITFSASCIEMFIWRIPGLSEYFIYSNDDIIPLKPLTIENFFINGNPIQYIEYGTNSLYSIYDIFLLNATLLVLEKYLNNDIYNSCYYPRHTLKPLKKSICEECYNKYKQFIDSSLTPIRFYNNLNIDLFLIYALKHNLLVNKKLNYEFSYIGTNDIKTLTKLYNNINNRLLDNIPNIICINDEYDIKDIKSIKYIQNLCINILNECLISL